jgi:phosphate transport system substrate-binding protein
MKNIFFALLIVILCAGCKKEKPNPEPQPVRPPLIEGLTLDNFPVMDGSTSTEPLVAVAAASLLGYEYRWERVELGSWAVTAQMPSKFTSRKLKQSQTHGSIVNLIDGGTDMAFVARGMSDDERVYATQQGVEIIETSVALDALVFLKNENVEPDPVPQSLTREQIVEIYTGRATNWNQLGGGDKAIIPIVRNRNSGSQELMESLVMTEPIDPDIAEGEVQDFDTIAFTMAGLFEKIIEYSSGAIGYTVFYYKENMIRDLFHVNMLAVDGVTPSKTTLADRTYPLVAEVYMMVRTDTPQGSMTWKVYEFLQTTAGKEIVAESGYVANPENLNK